MTEALFVVARSPDRSLAARQAAVLVRALAEEEPWGGTTFREVADGLRTGDGRAYEGLVTHGLDELRELSPEQQEQVFGQMEHLANLHELSAVRADASASKADADVSKLRLTVACAHDARRVHHERLAKEAARRDLGPPFSAHVETFITRKRADDGWDDKTVHQSRATFALWMEFMGDLPVRSVTVKLADDFLVALRSLPAGYGKDVKSKVRKTAREWLAVAEAREARGLVVPRMKAKTAKRHFSALSQYWQWLRVKEHVGENAFRGHEHAGAKTKRTDRDDWSDADLLRLLASPWLRDAPADSARRWLVLLAAWTGGRVEELARLRPCDVTSIDGAPCILVQPHPDGWTPKSEAGERVIPLHPALLGYGLLDFVERRRAEGAARLFPELRPSGPSKSYSAAFSREFSRKKVAAGVGRKTTFHSFRANVSDLTP